MCFTIIFSIIIWIWNTTGGPLKGIHKLLKPISDFLKGDRNIEYLLNTYCLAQQQAMLENSIAWFRNCYNKEALADIGILPKTEPSQGKT